jgi:hypothetical protein
MTACTATEESEWRSRLCQPPGADSNTRAPGLNLFLSIDIMSLGAIFGRPGIYLFLLMGSNTVTNSCRDDCTKLVDSSYLGQRVWVVYIARYPKKTRVL